MAAAMATKIIILEVFIYHYFGIANLVKIALLKSLSFLVKILGEEGGISSDGYRI